MNNLFYYIIQFIIGGTLFTLIYHFSKVNNTIICSILPAFPTLFLTGFFYLMYFGGNIKQYIKNTIYTFSADVILMIILYLTIKYLIKNIYISLIVSFIIYFYIFLYLTKNILK